MMMVIPTSWNHKVTYVKHVTQCLAQNLRKEDLIFTLQ